MDRLQPELLRALGKPCDHAAQGFAGVLGQLARGWLEAETAGHLIVLRAHQIHGLALAWLLSLAPTSRFHLWLISPTPLPAVGNHAGQAAVDIADPADAVISLARAHTDHHGDCHDLNQPIPELPADNRANGGLTLAAAVRLRRLYHLDTAAIAAAALLLGRPEPQTLAATTIHVAPDAATLHIAGRPDVTVPDHAHALLRSQAGQPVLGRRWPRLIAAAYWAVQLDHASHHTGIRMYDPLPII